MAKDNTHIGAETPPTSSSHGDTDSQKNIDIERNKKRDGPFCLMRLAIYCQHWHLLRDGSSSWRAVRGRKLASCRQTRPLSCRLLLTAEAGIGANTSIVVLLAYTATACCGRHTKPGVRDAPLSHCWRQYGVMFSTAVLNTRGTIRPIGEDSGEPHFVMEFLETSG